MNLLRIELKDAYWSLCKDVHEDECITLLPAMYWWVPCIPLMQYFQDMLDKYSRDGQTSLRYWGSKYYGCDTHRRKACEMAVFMKWRDPDLEDWLETDERDPNHLGISHICGN
jgi:hypothetical protein